MAANITEIDDLKEKLRVQAIKERLAKEAAKDGSIDFDTGAPNYVRQQVGAADSREDRLATLRQFFPDAFIAPGMPDNFLFRNPETNRLTLYNPKGLDVGDLFSLSVEGGEAIGGTVGAVGGVIAGAPSGPAGAVTGGILGAAGGAEVGARAVRGASRLFGETRETRPVGERLAESGIRMVTAGAGEAGGMALGRLMQTALRRGPRAPAEVSRRAMAFSRAGAVPSASMLTQNRMLTALDATLSRLPGGGGVFARRAQGIIDNVQGTIEKRVAGISADPTSAGRVVQKGIVGEGGFVARVHDTAAAIRKPLDNALRGTNVDISNTLRVLDDIAGPVPGAEATSAALASPSLRALRKSILQDAGLMDEAGEIIISDLSALPYDAVRRIRQSIGQKLTDPSILQDLPKRELRSLYRALSDDIRAAAEKAGPDALKAFNRHNKFFSAAAKRIEESLDGLTGKVNVEDIFSTLERSGKEGATTLNRVRRSLKPEEWSIVAKTVLRRMGRATPGQQDEFGSAFSLDRFLTNFNRMSDEAKDALFAGMDGMRQDLDAIATVASTLRENARVLANPSGTAQAVISGSAVSGASMAGLTGNVDIAMYIGLTAMGNYGASVLVTSPAFMKLFAQAGKIPLDRLGAHLGRIGQIAADPETDPDVRAAVQDFMRVFIDLPSVQEVRNPTP